MKVKNQNLITTNWKEVKILSQYEGNILELLKKNRWIKKEDEEKFFEPKLSDLYNPLLLPDIEKSVNRILEAIKNQERIVIFGDYDVDWVSSSAIMVRFLSNELKAKISYRLPHRVNDGYGLKNYFFDELKQKWVTLVITVDCGTRDIEPIAHAKKLGIDVIVTDHHAVPDIIPEDVIGIINPKRKDAIYPFSGLAGAGVAFKVVHAILLKIENSKDEIWKDIKWKMEEILIKYIDFASLWTVSDCMPLIDENRVITTLWLKQIKKSESVGLRKFVENSKDIEWNAEIIWFQIWPRINASGRMSTPLTALRWLLAGENRSDEFLEQLEQLNNQRKWIVQDFVEKAIKDVDNSKWILFFLDKNLEHGIIWLVAWKLTEKYNKVSFVMCEHHEVDWSISYVASCRAPEWCNLMEILDNSKDLLIRYWWHNQAAGFSVSPQNLEKLKERTIKKFNELYPTIPLPTVRVECKIPPYDANLDFLREIEKFKPFWIGNPKPQFLFENVEVTEIKFIWSEWKHLKISIKENPLLPIIFWWWAEESNTLKVWEKINIIVDFDKNIFNNKENIQAFVKYICKK